MIGRSQRTFVVGKTRSGKSVLARALFQSVAPPRCVIDPKDDPDATGGRYADRRQAVTFSDPARLPDAESIRFVPKDPMDLDAYGAVYRALFERRGVFVWCDEAGLVFPARGNAPAPALRLVTQGARYGIGHLALNQRPVETAPALQANTEHWIVFFVGHTEDVKTIASQISILTADLQADLIAMPPYGFLWYDAGAGVLRVCPPIDNRR